MKFNKGDCVEVNGNQEAIILNCYEDNMYEVRLFSGLRHIGDITIDKKYIKLQQEVRSYIDYALQDYRNKKGV